VSHPRGLRNLRPRPETGALRDIADRVSRSRTPNAEFRRPRQVVEPMTRSAGWNIRIAATGAARLADLAQDGVYKPSAFDLQ